MFRYSFNNSEKSFTFLKFCQVRVTFLLPPVFSCFLPRFELRKKNKYFEFSPHQIIIRENRIEKDFSLYLGPSDRRCCCCRCINFFYRDKGRSRRHLLDFQVTFMWVIKMGGEMHPENVPFWEDRKIKVFYLFLEAECKTIFEFSFLLSFYFSNHSSKFDTFYRSP